VESWQATTALYLVERVGKGLRTPVRNVILAEVSEGIGRGKGFGIHELMDQLGAVADPLLVATITSFYCSYRAAFLALFSTRSSICCTSDYSLSSISMP
jgi:hypothetical protein